MLKLLIDECLSEELVHLARNDGYVESSHVAWIGKRGYQDRDLMPIILNGDWTLVTNNSFDFRGHAATPGTRGHYAQVTVHAGLISLNWAHGLASLGIQKSCFELALIELKQQPDFVNKCLEISVDSNRQAEVVVYDLPIV